MSSTEEAVQRVSETARSAALASNNGFSQISCNRVALGKSSGGQVEEMGGWWEAVEGWGAVAGEGCGGSEAPHHGRLGHESHDNDHLLLAGCSATAMRLSSTRRARGSRGTTLDQ